MANGLKPLKFMELLQNFGWLGFWAAIGTGFLLKFISQLVSTLPGVNLSLQAISVETTGLGGVVQTGFSESAKKLFGLVSFATLPEWIFVGIGGALFVMLGAYAVVNIKALQFAKTKQGKLATILVTAAIVSGWILSLSIGLPTISGILVMSINAYVLSWIFIIVDNFVGTKLTKAV